MRRLSFSVILLLVLFSACHKELPGEAGDGYGERVTRTLKRVLPTGVQQALDYGRAVRTPADSMGRIWLRLPFKGQNLSEGFVLVQTTQRGEVTSGRIIRLQRHKIVPYRYDGAITIRTLEGTLLTQSSVAGGHILAWPGRPPAQQAASLMPSGYQEGAELVVASSTDGTYSEWVSLEGLSGVDESGYYYPLGSSGGGGSYEDGGSEGGSGSEDGLLAYGDIEPDSPILIDYETQDDLDPIDIQKYIQSFNAIPDEGSICSIEIFTDVPVDSDPYLIFDYNNGSPGHTFIQIKKSNGSLSVLQNIGFYPKSGLKAVLTNAPIPGKFVDNGGHEYNASIKMNMSPGNFRSTLTEIMYLANFIQYDIDNYNCTDFALDVFNKTRTSKLDIDLFHIPGNYPSAGTRTPQGLYKKLKEMKDSHHPEALNITMGILKGWVAASSGPYN